MSTERATSEPAAGYTVERSNSLLADAALSHSEAPRTRPHPPHLLRRAWCHAATRHKAARSESTSPGSRGRSPEAIRRLHSASSERHIHSHPLVGTAATHPARRRVDVERSARRSRLRPSRTTPQRSRRRFWPRRTAPAALASRRGRLPGALVAPRRRPSTHRGRVRRSRSSVPAPAGLACANDLALLGHRAILFETRAEPGGLLTGGIPGFRFPVASARAECAAVLTLDAEFRGGRAVESLISLLANGYEAAFLAIGAVARRDVRPGIARATSGRRRCDGRPARSHRAPRRRDRGR